MRKYEEYADCDVRINPPPSYFFESINKVVALTFRGILSLFLSLVQKNSNELLFISIRASR